jgi:hypothetical protein
VIEAEAELKALQRHAIEVVDPETDSIFDSGARNPLVGSSLQPFSAEPSSWLRRGATEAAAAGDLAR